LVNHFDGQTCCNPTCMISMALKEH
jgi:hypothetical protein